MNNNGNGIPTGPPASRQARATRAKRLRHLGCIGLLAAIQLALAGCNDQQATLREIRNRQQQQLEQATDIDHLREMHRIVAGLGESNLQTAAGRVSYHLNAWRSRRGEPSETPTPDALLTTWRGVLPVDEAIRQIEQQEYREDDIQHLRLQYLLHRLRNWVLDKSEIDPWLEQRIADESLDEDAERKLTVAARLFDWVVRNVQLEPAEPVGALPPAPPMPAGLQFEGAGYRQTSWETLWRGVGDAWQRADLFTQLCRQAQIDACVLAIPPQSAAAAEPWMAAVRVGDGLYLFDTQFGIPVPGPDERGIATLQEARTDPSVLRRLRVPGIFEYPYTNEDVQQTIALVNATPELLSQRMRRLNASLTGDSRFDLFLDATALAERLDAIPGVAGVRLWQVPLQSRIYQTAIQAALRDDIRLNQWYFLKWGIFAETGQLAQARWRHLEGRFDSDDLADVRGSRVLYMDLRLPEFELKDLNLDLELQQQYNLRRMPGEDETDYQRRVAFMQDVLRETKRTATFWIGLMHIEEGRWETAVKWLEGRVLDDPQAGRWYPLARYNLARAMEQLGQRDRVEQLYKTDGDPQEQGNRIRERLLPEAE